MKKTILFLFLIIATGCIEQPTNETTSFGTPKKFILSAALNSYCPELMELIINGKNKDEQESFYEFHYGENQITMTFFEDGTSLIIDEDNGEQEAVLGNWSLKKDQFGYGNCLFLIDDSIHPFPAYLIENIHTHYDEDQEGLIMNSVHMTRTFINDESSVSVDFIIN